MNTESHLVANHITESELLALANDVSEVISDYNMNCSRAVSTLDKSLELSKTEQKIAQKSSVLIDEGIEIRNQLIEIQNTRPESLSLTSEEISAIQRMTDDQLALCALQLNTLCEYENMMIEPEQLQITSNVYIDCALHATGITDWIHLISAAGGYALGGYGFGGMIVNGNKMLINAKTAGKILKAFAVKYIGWFGVGVMLYDYAICVNENK